MRIRKTHVFLDLENENPTFSLLWEKEGATVDDEDDFESTSLSEKEPQDRSGLNVVVVGVLLFASHTDPSYGS